MYYIICKISFTKHEFILLLMLPGWRRSKNSDNHILQRNPPLLRGTSHLQRHRSQTKQSKNLLQCLNFFVTVFLNLISCYATSVTGDSPSDVTRNPPQQVKLDFNSKPNQKNTNDYDLKFVTTGSEMKTLESPTCRVWLCGTTRSHEVTCR